MSRPGKLVKSVTSVRKISDLPLSIPKPLADPTIWFCEVHHDPAGVRALRFNLGSTFFRNYKRFHIEESSDITFPQMIENYIETKKILDEKLEKDSVFRKVSQFIPHRSRSDIRAGLKKFFPHAPEENLDNFLILAEKTIGIADNIKLFTQLIAEGRSVINFDLPFDIESMDALHQVTTPTLMAKRNMNFSKQAIDHSPSINLVGLGHLQEPLGMGIEDILKRKLPPEEFIKHIFLYIYSQEPYTDAIQTFQEKYQDPHSGKLVSIKMTGEKDYAKLPKIIEEIMEYREKSAQKETKDEKKEGKGRG